MRFPLVLPEEQNMLTILSKSGIITVLAIAVWHICITEMKNKTAIAEKEKTMSQEKTSSAGEKVSQAILIILCCLIGLVLIVLLAARAYFRISVREYYANSKKAFVIPGLSDGMIHQGLAYDSENDTFLITGYRSDGKASQLSMVSKSDGKEIKRLDLAKEDGSIFTGHVGGITLHKNYIYIANGKGLIIFDRNDILAASDGDSVKAIGIFKTTSDDDSLGVAFTHVEKDMIYVGEFYREANYKTPDSHKYKTAAGDENTALIIAYRLDDTAPFGISEKIERAYSAPALVQGMCFDGEGNIYLSTSYAVAFSHIYAYDPTKQEGSITVLGQTVPLYVLDSSTQTADIKIAPMSEEIVILDGKLYVMCESATNKYIFGKFTSAKYCYATDLSKYRQDE